MIRSRQEHHSRRGSVTYHGLIRDMSRMVAILRVMKTLLQLQLSLWRSACRHVHIADAIDGLHEAIANAAPVRNTWILSISGGRCTLEASCPHDGREFSVVGAETERLARFAAKGGLSTLDPMRPGRSLLRSLAAWFAAASGG